MLQPSDLSADDLRHLRRAVEVAAEAVDRGDHAFGAVLVDGSGAVLGEAGNTVESARDVTGHAELNVVREASAVHDRAEMRGATLYASTEPCAMCAAAAYWLGVGRVVFALAASDLRAMQQPGEPGLDLPLREVVGRAVADPVDVVGPVALPEATSVHGGAGPAPR